MKKNILFLIACSSLMLEGCKRITLEHYHYYDPATQEWDVSFDNAGHPTSATVSVKCANTDEKCPEVTKVLNTTITNEIVEEANCCEQGLLRYTAKAVFNNVTYSRSYDFAIDKTAHDFENYTKTKEGHVKECSICGLHAEDFAPHSYGLEGESVYTCSVCDYVDLEKKTQYENEQKLANIIENIQKAVTETSSGIKPYHEHFIRDIDRDLKSISEEEKTAITNLNAFNTLKAAYAEKYKVLFDDITEMTGENPNETISNTTVNVEKNKLDDNYGYGFKFNVITSSKDNYLKYKVSKPTSYTAADNVEGVFYTYNVPSTSVIRVISEKGDFMVGGTDNVDLGNGWVERKINTTRMNYLLDYTYSYAKLTLGIDESQKLPEGEYFISCFYIVLPEKATTGKHYSYKASTTEATGNKEYWQIDGSSNISLTNPDTTIAWTDATSPALSSTSEAFIAKKGTINVSTTSDEGWTVTTHDSPDSKNALAFGLKPSGETGGDYAFFKNYQWTDWGENKPGVDAEYVLSNTDNIRLVNKLNFTYYAYEPKTSINVKISVLDYQGNEKAVFNESVGHCTGPVTKSIDINEINFYKLKINTKAYASGINGFSNFMIKNISAEYTEQSIPTGNVTIPTANTSDWSHSVNDGTNKFFVGTNTVYSSTPASGDYLTLRVYQWSDWQPTKAGVTATYSSSDTKIVNSLSFKYFVNSSYFEAVNGLVVKIYIIDNVSNETLIDTLNVTNSVTKDADISYSKSFSDTVFSKLKIVVSSNEAYGYAGSMVLFLTDISVNYIEE